MSGAPRIRADQLPHGTRGRYVGARCRCAPCRAANTAYYHTRMARARAALEGFEAGPPEPSTPERWRARGGAVRTRVHRAGRCPGLDADFGCPHAARLRADSQGGICHACREDLIRDPIVPADRARRHLAVLRKRNVGRLAVAAASDVGATTLARITAGAKHQIRQSTERRILAVDAGARSDGALVPAAPTWRLIERMLVEARMTRGELARLLGAQTPKLQLRRDFVRASTAQRVARLARRVLDDPGNPHPGHPRTFLPGGRQLPPAGR